MHSYWQGLYPEPWGEFDESMKQDMYVMSCYVMLCYVIVSSAPFCQYWFLYWNVCVCVCVWERERETEREIGVSEYVLYCKKIVRLWQSVTITRKRYITYITYWVGFGSSSCGISIVWWNFNIWMFHGPTNSKEGLQWLSHRFFITLFLLNTRKVFYFRKQRL